MHVGAACRAVLTFAAAPPRSLLPSSSSPPPPFRTCVCLCACAGRRREALCGRGCAPPAVARRADARRPPRRVRRRPFRVQPGHVARAALAAPHVRRHRGGGRATGGG
eukprot:149221-Chlamydomonas_euryale.AAC.1